MQLYRPATFTPPLPNEPSPATGITLLPMNSSQRLAIRRLQIQALHIHILKHPHVHTRHAREEIRIDTARHAARTTRAAEVVRDFGLGAEGIGLRSVVSISILNDREGFDESWRYQLLKSEVLVESRTYLQSLKLALVKFNTRIRHVDEEIPVARTDATIAFCDCGAGVVEGWGGGHCVSRGNMIRVVY